MISRSRTRAAIAALALIAASFPGCGNDSERKIVRDAHPTVPSLAPGSESGLGSGQVDPGAASAPASGAR